MYCFLQYKTHLRDRIFGRLFGCKTSAVFRVALASDVFVCTKRHFLKIKKTITIFDAHVEKTNNAFRPIKHNTFCSQSPSKEQFYKRILNFERDGTNHVPNEDFEQ